MKLSSLLALTFVAHLTVGGGPALSAPEKARPSDAFVETVGVGSRFDWIRSDGNLDKAKAALRESGTGR